MSLRILILREQTNSKTKYDIKRTSNYKKRNTYYLFARLFGNSFSSFLSLTDNTNPPPVLLKWECLKFIILTSPFYLTAFRLYLILSDEKHPPLPNVSTVYNSINCFLLCPSVLTSLALLNILKVEFQNERITRDDMCHFCHSLAGTILYSWNVPTHEHYLIKKKKKLCSNHCVQFINKMLQPHFSHLGASYHALLF